VDSPASCTRRANRAGRPFSLTLTGPAGGAFTSNGAGAPADTTALDAALEPLDAVEFCRTLAGRAEGNDVLDTIVPF
jgi:hypothetical protein